MGDSNSKTILTATLQNDGQWKGELRTEESKIIGDHGRSATWEIPVSLEPVQLAPALIAEGRGAVDPIRLRLNQPVACDSLEIDLVDAMGRKPAYETVSNCGSSSARDYPAGYTSDISLVPATYWNEANYTVRTGILRGLSSIASENGQADLVRLMPFVSEGAGLDFEVSDTSSWTPENGRANCKVVTSLVTPKGSTIEPESGSRMLSCEPRDFGFNSVVGQFRIPQGSRAMSVMVASRESVADVPLLLELWRQKAPRREPIVVSREAVIQKPENGPTHWTGWHKVEMPIPPGVSALELEVGMFGCLTLETQDQCAIPNHLLLDHIQFY